MLNPREITKQATAWAGIGACLALGFAGYATVETDNEVGTAAFVLVGLYLVIVAITGRAPRVKYGDNEIDPRAAAQAAAATTADALEGVAQLTAKSTDTTSPDDVAAAVTNAAQSIIETSAHDAVGSGRQRVLRGPRLAALGSIYDHLPPNVRRDLINRSGILPDHHDPSGARYSQLSLNDQIHIAHAMEELGVTGEPRDT